MLNLQKFFKKKQFEDFGYLLGESWQKKRELAKKISTGKIDNLFSKGIKNGAIGGKLLGAGGGGMLYFMFR